MRYLTILLLSGLGLMASCTPPVVSVRYTCDGYFTITEESPRMAGRVDITSRPNIDSVEASIFNLDPTRKDPIILVTGKVVDVCKNTSISYTGPEGAGTTVNLGSWTMTGMAPRVAYAARDGKFSYEIKLSCCPGTEGKSHDVDVEASMTVLYVKTNTNEVRCTADNRIVVEGQMANENSGRVTVIITNEAGGRCEYQTLIARDL